MNRHGLLLLLAAPILFFGCSGDDDTDELTDGNAIGFHCLTANTYAQEVTANNMQNFLVSGIWAKSGTEFEPTYMDRQLVERKGTDWVYSPVRYWPTSGFVNFFAYSPAYSSGIKSFQINNTNYENVVIEYDVTTDPQNQEDFVVATSLEQTSGNVQLDYQHALSRVEFQVCSGDDNMEHHIFEIALYNLDRKGTLTGTASGSPKTTTWAWSDNTLNSEKKEKYVVYQKDTVVVEYNDFKSFTDPDVGDLMILPQVVTLGSKDFYTAVDFYDGIPPSMVGEPKDLNDKFYIGVKYNAYYAGLGGAEPEVGLTFFTLGTDSEPFEFEPGKKYTFRLRIIYVDVWAMSGKPIDYTPTPNIICEVLSEPIK